MAGYTIVYVTQGKELLTVVGGQIAQTITIDQTQTAVDYADYDALITGMDGLSIDYTTDWDRVFVPKIV